LVSGGFAKEASTTLLGPFPILLECGDVSRGSRSFKFENKWLKVEGFCGSGETMVGFLRVPRNTKFCSPTAQGFEVGFE
jgi:hypothetical protein